MTVSLLVGSDGLQNNASAAAQVLGAPINLVAIPGNEEVELSWTAPTDTGTSAITDYTIMYREQTEDENLQWTTYDDGKSIVTTATVKKLTNGKYYEFIVGAVNDDGRGSWARTTATVGVPGAPLNLVATSGIYQVTLNWDAPDSEGGSSISDYVIQYKKRVDDEFTIYKEGTNTRTTLTIHYLSDTTYEFRVAARNQVNQGSWSNIASATPQSTSFGPPTNLIAVPENGLVKLSWTTPSDVDRSLIIGYRVEFKTDKTSFGNGSRVIGTSTTVYNLNNGVEYTFRVATMSPSGASSWSETISTTPRTIPGGINGLNATAGDAQVKLDWAAPINNGGAEITDYIIEYQINGAEEWTRLNDGVNTSTTITITELTSGSLYSFAVAAVNTAGTGPWFIVHAYPT